MEIFPALKVYISTHQLAEIYHVLAFRGARLPREEAANIVLAILKDGDIVKVPLLQRHVEEAIKESATSGIHVWDYLCFLPVKDYVDTISSCKPSRSLALIIKYFEDNSLINLKAHFSRTSSSQKYYKAMMDKPWPRTSVL